MIKEINLLDALQHVSDYVLLRKWDDFPNWLPGSDIDILTLNCQESLRALLPYLNTLTNGYEAYIKVSELSFHIHVDIIKDEKLLLRFDLMDNFEFPNFEIMPSYKTFVFMNRVKTKVNNQLIFIPQPIDDMLIRYFEYIAWFQQRPEKIKHLEFILNNTNEEIQNQMFSNAHRFIRYTHKTWNTEIGFQGDIKKLNKSNSSVLIFRKMINFAKKILKKMFPFIKRKSA